MTVPCRPKNPIWQALIPRSDRRHPTAGTEYKYCKHVMSLLFVRRANRSADAVKPAEESVERLPM